MIAYNELDFFITPFILQSRIVDTLRYGYKLDGKKTNEMGHKP
jgi:hypothetical protein